MANIKEFNNKLKSLSNTKKITKTMKMVSASKLRKAQEAQANAKLYARGLTEMISRIATNIQSTSHPLITPRAKQEKALILVITSDKGLCGAFNNNVNKRVALWIKENENVYPTIDIAACGKRGFMFFRRSGKVKTHYENATLRPDYATATKIGQDLVTAFLTEQYDEIYLTYNQFFSPISQKTTLEKILPISPSEIITEKSIRADYIFEPDENALLEELIPHYLYFKIYFALLENSAGEHGARMSAMDNATKNASDLINRYTLLRNRARQAAITTELTEIVAGAEALH